MSDSDDLQEAVYTQPFESPCNCRESGSLGPSSGAVLMGEPRQPSRPTASIDPATLVESIRARHGITLPLARIAELCRRRGIRALALFGSIFRDDFRRESDIDLLVDYEPESRPKSFAEEFAVRGEFEALLGPRSTSSNAKGSSGVRTPSEGDTSSRRRSRSMSKDEGFLLDMLMAARDPGTPGRERSGQLPLRAPPGARRPATPHDHRRRGQSRLPGISVRAPDISWRAMTGQRDILIHAYARVDIEGVGLGPPRRPCPDRSPGSADTPRCLEMVV
jgi:predicted nucleotidyltransferase